MVSAGMRSSAQAPCSLLNRCRSSCQLSELKANATAGLNAVSEWDVQCLPIQQKVDGLENFCAWRGSWDPGPWEGPPGGLGTGVSAGGSLPVSVPGEMLPGTPSPRCHGFGKVELKVSIDQLALLPMFAVLEQLESLAPTPTIHDVPNPGCMPPM